MSDSKISCPNCAGQVAFPEEMAGQSAACPHCGESILLQNPNLPTVQVSTSKGAVIEVLHLDSADIWRRAINEAFRREGLTATVELQSPPGSPAPAPRPPLDDAARRTYEENLQRYKNRHRQAFFPEADILLREAGIEIKDGWLTIEEPFFFGEFCRSPDGRFIMAWRQSTYGAGGRLAESGNYLFFDGPTVISKGRLHSPQGGRVANNGTFILCDANDSSSGESEGSATMEAFLAFKPSGGVIIKEQFRGCPNTCAISDDGRFAMCSGVIVRRPDVNEMGSLDEENEPGESDESADYEDRLCLFDLDQRKMIAWFAAVTVPGERDYRIDPAEKIVRVVYKNGVVHRYGFDGSFLDADAWETQRADFASGYELLNMAEYRLQAHQGSDLASFSDVMSLLDLALAKGVSEFTQAKIHRHLGEIYDLHDEKTKALEHLETALRLYPKIGVKKQVARLRTGG